MTNSDEHDPLTNALRAAADADAAAGVSAAVEARLRAELKLIRLAQRRRQNTVWLSVAAALAIVAAGWWAFAHRTDGSRFVSVGPATAAISEIRSDFMPLPYSSVPTPSVRMVRLEVPRQALASFGLASGDLIGAVSDSGTATVTADVLVGDDGLARAVRFVRPIGRKE